MFFTWYEMLPNRAEEMGCTVNSGLCWQNYMFIKYALRNERGCESKPHEAFISRECCLPLSLPPTCTWFIFLELTVNEAIACNCLQQKLRRAESCVLMCSLERDEYDYKVARCLDGCRFKRKNVRRVMPGRRFFKIALPHSVVVKELVISNRSLLGCACLIPIYWGLHSCEWWAETYLS